MTKSSFAPNAWAFFAALIIGCVMWNGSTPSKILSLPMFGVAASFLFKEVD